MRSRTHLPGAAVALTLVLASLTPDTTAQTFARVWIDELLDADHAAAEQAYVRIGNDSSRSTETRALALGRAAELARATGRETDHQKRMSELASLVGRARRHSLAVPPDPLPRSGLREALSETDPTRAERALAANRDRFLRSIDGTTRIRVYVEPIRRLTLTARDLEYARLRTAIRAAESKGDEEGAVQARRDLQRRMLGESIRRRVRGATIRLLQSLAAGRVDDADDLRERGRGPTRANLTPRREPRAEPDAARLGREIDALARQAERLDPTADPGLIAALQQLVETLRKRVVEEDLRGAEDILSRVPRTF